jgi:ribulose-5-phosphate 4-epimerase/fuculose-1-phosphate aldolase
LKAVSISEQRDEPMLHRRERVALAASFRWAARLNLHEGVANHFSRAVNDGPHFLLNNKQRLI